MRNGGFECWSQVLSWDRQFKYFLFDPSPAQQRCRRVIWQFCRTFAQCPFDRTPSAPCASVWMRPSPDQSLGSKDQGSDGSLLGFQTSPGLLWKETFLMQNLNGTIFLKLSTKTEIIVSRMWPKWRSAPPTPTVGFISCGVTSRVTGSASTCCPVSTEILEWSPAVQVSLQLPNF